MIVSSSATPTAQGISLADCLGQFGVYRVDVCEHSIDRGMVGSKGVVHHVRNGNRAAERRDKQRSSSNLAGSSERSRRFDLGIMCKAALQCEKGTSCEDRGQWLETR